MFTEEQYKFAARYLNSTIRSLEGITYYPEVASTYPTFRSKDEEDQFFIYVQKLEDNIKSKKLAEKNLASQQEQALLKAKEEEKKEKKREVARIQHDKVLQRQYGVTQAEWDEMYLSQDGKCAICKKDERIVHKALTMALCPVSNKARALLCEACSTGLRAFQDQPSLLREAIEFLVKFEGLKTSK